MADVGAPIGNQNAAKAKKWREALSRALARNSEGKSVDSGLDKVADQVVTQAFAGEKDAWQEIATRFDGKPPQAIIGGDEDDPPLKFQKIERAIVDPSNSNS